MILPVADTRADPTLPRAWIVALAIAGLALALVAGMAMGVKRIPPVDALIALYDRAIYGVWGREAAPPVDDHAARYAEIDASLSGSPDIMMVGDSITALGRWNELLPGFEVHNRGFGGDTVENVLARAEALRAKNAGVTVLLVGINDIMRRRPASDIARRYREVAVALSGENRALVLVSVLPCRGERCSASINREIDVLNSEIAAIAQATGARYIDLHSAIEVNGALDPAVSIDGIHINAQGYRRFAAAVRELAPELLEREGGGA